MTAEERAEIVVTARLLRAGATIQWLAVGLTILAAAAIIQRQGLVAAIAALLLGLIAIFYGLRASFDARLFEDIAAEVLTTSELDEALSVFGRKNKPRSWPDRCRGARRLVAYCTIAALSQLVILLLIRWS